MAVRLLKVGANLLVVALELLMDVEEALGDSDVAAVAPSDRLVVSDEIMSTAIEIIVVLIVHLLTRARLAL